MTCDQLNRLKSEALSQTDFSRLTDIRALKVDTSKDIHKRVSRFIDSVGNPYLFKADGVTVRVCFRDGAFSLQESLKRAILSELDGENV